MSPSTFLDPDNWIRAVLASDLPHVAVRLAVRIAHHLHVGTGRCNPSYAALAAGSHIAERSVYRLVALLDHTGWIGIQRTRGRLPNQYMLRNPANPMAGLSHANPAKPMTGLNPANPDSGDNPTLPNHASNPANRLADKKRRKAKRKAKEERLSQPPDFFDEAKQADSRQEEKNPAPKEFGVIHTTRRLSLNLRDSTAKSERGTSIVGTPNRRRLR